MWFSSYDWRSFNNTKGWVLGPFFGWMVAITVPTDRVGAFVKVYR